MEECDIRHDKVSLFIRLDPEIHQWLSELSITENALDVDISQWVNKHLAIAKDLYESETYQARKAKQERFQDEQIQLLKKLLQSSVESLMILRNKVLADEESQSKLSKDVKEMLQKQFSKIEAIQSEVEY